MKRELIRHSEGYWSLIDERGQLICKFKVGDKVSMICDFRISPLEGNVYSVEFCENYNAININTFYTEQVGIEEIEKMEVIE